VAATDPIPTADVLDRHPDAQVCALAFRSFGGRTAFAGTVVALRCDEDNVLLKQRVTEPGHGRVLVVDGGGSLRVALLGDRLASAAAANGWAGLVINGAVRDSAALAVLPIGILALGTCPRPSARQGAGAADEPVTFGGITFTPGAILHADADGVVIPDAPK
jgi:regulator of ribonuclease activity A